MIDDKEWARDNGLHSFFGLPIQLEDQKVGVIVLFFKTISISEDLSKSLTTIISALGLSIEREQAEEELKDRIKDLERFGRLTINREEKMIQLKEEINTLLGQMGKENKYKIVV